LVRTLATEVPVGLPDPVRPIAPVVATEYWLTLRPTWKEFCPFRLIDIEIDALVLNAFIKSARRPPQPV